MTVAPKLAHLARDYPDIVLDITADDRLTDIVAGGFDAGIHFGEYIERDMIAVRVSPDHRPAIEASPEYFRSNLQAKSPRDLLSHRCINFPARVHWSVPVGIRKRQKIALRRREGPLIVDDVELLVRAALDGIGVAFVSENHVALFIQSGQLVRVLEDWRQPFPGFFLYHPSRHQPAALSALIRILRR